MKFSQHHHPRLTRLVDHRLPRWLAPRPAKLDGHPSAYAPAAHRDVSERHNMRIAGPEVGAAFASISVAGPVRRTPAAGRRDRDAAAIGIHLHVNSISQRVAITGGVSMAISERFGTAGYINAIGASRAVGS